MFSVAFFDDPHTYYDQAHHLWEAAETRYNLILGLALRLQSDLHAYGEAMPMMALVRDEIGEIRASALMTPPFALIVQSEPLDRAALEALADALIESGWHLPGVNGIDAVSDCFAEIWQEKTRQQPRRIVNTRAYELSQVLSVSYPLGKMKIADASEAPLAAEMLNAMSEEVVLGPRRLYTADLALESIQQRRTFFWVDNGEVVCITLATRPQIKGICVSGVYTPPAFRRKGYARALVAEVSKELLSRGYEFTNLFTDLSNPTSNKIYQEIGYKPVCDYHRYEFVDQA
ncbi:MAG TPA: GNAT family N-acetyltransferase [Anaerolineaceae bacterium]|nr:GNAT family N-acetyltransferase [Anaerolineaceae bacterium]